MLSDCDPAVRMCNDAENGKKAEQQGATRIDGCGVLLTVNYR